MPRSLPWDGPQPALAILALAVASLTPSGRAAAQSDPSSFSTVINAPPTIIGAGQSIDSDTQLNVMDDPNAPREVEREFRAGRVDGTSSNIEVNLLGGVINYGFEANAGATVNISGGSLGIRPTANSGSTFNISGGQVASQFTANSGSVVNIGGGEVGLAFDAEPGSVVSISGGAVGTLFDALPGSDVTLRGGTVGPIFAAHPGSDVTLVGGEFLLNGAPLGDGVSVTLQGADVLTGTLEDGSPFVFSAALDSLSGVTLQAGVLPPLDLAPIRIDGPEDVVPTGLRAGQTLTLSDGGALGKNFAAVGATLNVEGGSIEADLEILGSIVNVAGGTVGSGPTLGDFAVFEGSTVNISGGSVSGGSPRAYNGATVNVSGGSLGSNFRAESGSTVNVSGGEVGDRFDAGSGSSVNISGGSIGAIFTAFSGSVVNISGGVFGERFRALPASVVTLIGGEFLLNGEAMDESIAVDFDENDVLTGTLQDGSPFVFSPLVGDFTFPSETQTVRLANLSLPPADTSPILIDEASDIAPAGLRAGQSLTLRGDGVLPDNFASVGATLQIDGGHVGENLELAGSSGVLSDGTIDRLTAFESSTIDVTGANLLSVNAFDSEVNVRSGSVADLFVGDGSVVNLTGGTSGGFQSTVSEGGEMNVSGGVLEGQSYVAEAGAFIHFAVLNAELAGTPLDGVLIPGVPLLIGERGLSDELTGRLTDGSEFSFSLSWFPFTASGNSISPDATVTVTLAPDALPGDFNGDGIVDAADYTRLRDDLAAAAAALDAAGLGGTNSLIAEVGFDLLRENFGAVSPPAEAAPEPTAVLLAMMGFGAVASGPRARALPRRRG